jgi:hypothetical protein
VSRIAAAAVDYADEGADYGRGRLSRVERDPQGAAVLLVQDVGSGVERPLLDHDAGDRLGGGGVGALVCRRGRRRCRLGLYDGHGST